MRLPFHAAWAVLLAGLPAAAQVREPAVLVQVASVLQPGTSVTVNLAPTGANNLIVVGLMFTNTGASPVGVTDNAPGGSNTYKLAADVSDPNHQYLFYAEGAKGGVTQVTVAGTYAVIDMIVAEYHGVARSGALDRVSAANNGFSDDGNWRTGLTPPTRRAPELLVVIGGGTYYTPDFIHRAGTGYNFVTTHTELGLHVSGLMMEDRVVTTVGSYEGTGFTQAIGGGKDIRYGIIATFYLEPSAFTYQYSNTRGGANLSEKVLTRANVNASTFGKLFTAPVDGYVHGQPLYLANVDMPGKGVHNVVYVATGHDSVYAFDADGSVGQQTAAPLWRASFINPDRGITTVPAADTGCSQAEPEIGISSTPVIDPASGTLYLVATTKEVAGGVASYVHRLHALDAATGLERPGSPVAIQASYPGAGDGGVSVVLDAKGYKQQAGLLLLNGVVYTAWTAHCEGSGRHGWLIGHDARTLEQVAVYSDTPNGSGGFLWAGGAAPAADKDGCIYVASGSGTFDYARGGGNLANSYIKFSTANGLAVGSYFTPFNFTALSHSDLDPGSGGVLLLPSETGSVEHPHLMVSAGKEGRIYLLDSDSLAGLQSAPGSQVVASLEGAVGGHYGAPAYYSNAVYFCGAGDNLKAFQIATGSLSPSPVSQSQARFGVPGCVPTVSSNGASDAIVWLLEAAGVLHAYNASDLRKELYNSNQIPGADSLGAHVRSSVPTVANGRVYAGTQNELVVYGLLATASPPLVAENAASGRTDPVAPGSLIAIYGMGLAQSTGAAGSFPLPGTLAGASVHIGNLTAPLLYAGPGQINAQVPFETPSGTVDMTVSWGNRVVAAGSLSVQRNAPGLFLRSPGRAAALNQDYSVNGADRPATAGSVLVAYLTGLGPVDNPVASGMPGRASPLSHTLDTVSAMVNGVAAEVQFAGLAPDLAGVYQVNLVVPQLPPGDYPLEISVGGASSNAATVSVN